EEKRLAEEARRAALSSTNATPQPLASQRDAQPPPAQRDVQPIERRTSNKGLIGAVVALAALILIGGTLYALLHSSPTSATPPGTDKVAPPGADAAPSPPAPAPKACRDPQSDYGDALNIYFKSKTEAARLLTCVINGSDEELAEKARKLLDDLHPAN